MAYASWSVVFGEQPSAAKWNILGTNDASFNDGTGIADDKVLTRHILADNITDNKLVYGKVRSRQGGSASDWGGTTASGNTTYDVSGSNVSIQVGTKTLTALTTTITFPTAFTNKPWVSAVPYGSGGIWKGFYVVSVTNTQFDFVSELYTQTLNCSWMAIGI